MIQVAIALSSLTGGEVVDTVGVPADFWFGSFLGLAGLGVIASFGIKNKKVSHSKNPL
jgi:predicted MFS family arabinose efflux permease